MNHLADIFKMIINYEWKLKYKCKKINQVNINKVSDSEDVSHKQTSRWNHVLYLIHSVLNETLKSHVFHFVCSRILTDFWVNYTTSHSVSYSFYSQLQLVCWTVKSCCTKMKRHFNENWYLMYWIDFLISVLIILIDILIDF